jgi:hypothetical protein
MPRRLFILLSIALGALVVAIPAAPAATQTINVSQSLFAEAGFFNTSGCVDTDTFAFASTGRSSSTGGPSASSIASVFIDSHDACAGTQLLSAFGTVSLASGEFQIDRTLASASLNTTVPVSDAVSGTTFPVSVALSWTGSGEVTRTAESVTSTGPGFVFNGRFIGTFDTSATAGGTVSDGTTNYASPQPTQSPDTFLGSVNSGSVSITH